MGGIVMTNLKNSITEGVNKRLQGLYSDKDKIDFLCEFLHDTLAYLDEEELNQVKGWLSEEEQTVQIEVKGGTVVDVRNLPEGCNYELIDRDVVEEER